MQPTQIICQCDGSACIIMIDSYSVDLRDIKYMKFHPDLL